MVMFFEKKVFGLGKGLLENLVWVEEKPEGERGGVRKWGR